MFEKNVSLKPFNTFGIEATATNFSEVNSIGELRKIISVHQDIFVLGGGSNILLTQDVQKPVIHLNTKGIQVIEERGNTVLVKAEAGENWHEFVLWCLKRNFGGLENLSLIPGNVGTSPMQNIGAYGVEIKDCFVSLDAIEISTGLTTTFSHKDCAFGYRESVFKNKLKGKFIIVNVTFELSSKNHRIHNEYGAIKDQLKQHGIEQPTIQDVSKAVISIRQSKLPDPKEIGNSGSFFKNPVVDLPHFIKIQKDFPKMPFYKVSDSEIKVPAGWLVETCGFKGKRFGDAGVHKNQALVLVNYQNAKGSEIFELAKTIQKEVLKRFQIELEMEVNIM